MMKQIQNIMRKVNTLGLSSVSLSCLIEEPSRSERDLFINAFLPALKQIICLKGHCHITHVRLVQEDRQSTEEFWSFFNTYVDQQRHLDSSQENLVNNSMGNTSEFQQQQNYPHPTYASSQSPYGQPLSTEFQ